MSVLWIDGFDQYTSLDNVNIKDGMTSAGYQIGYFGGAVSSSSTRTGVGKCVTVGYLNGFARAIPTSGNLITGFAVLASGTEFTSIFGFMVNDFLGSQWSMLDLYRNANGALTAIVRNKGGGVIASYHSAENTIYAGVWHYVEIKYVPSATSGTIIVKVDGLAVITAIGVRTMDPAMPGGVNILLVPSQAAGVGNAYDDWYVLSNDGSGLTDFLGDVVAHAVFPNADASPNEMSQFGGTVGHWSVVSDYNAADDAAYVYTSTTGKRELFELNDLPSDIIDVLAVQVAVRARKDTAGVSNYKIMAQIGSDLYESPSVATTTQYLTKFVNLENAPGGGAWTIPKAQQLQIGFETVE